ncbi:ribonuclease H family protein [Rhodococcus kronopolitis]|uniref:Ribonuclease H family protein n=1 Tax=Rhodococcus kronopolitis TaxID=1460226 RepID=A0ABV9FRJ8_9NOCA
MTIAVIHSRHTAGTESELSLSAATTLDGTTLATRVFTRAGTGDEHRRATALDAFEYVHEHAAGTANPTPVYVSDAGLRTELLAVAGSFTAINLVGAPRGRMPALLLAAANAMSEHVADLAAAAAAAAGPLPELVVATDASKCTRRRGVGVACVRADGVRRQKMVPDVGSVLVGELLAIELAVSSFRDRPLHVLTDSRAALACLGSGHPNRGEVARTVDRIHHLNLGGRVRFSWVRGHDGHPLNEAAHRLAVAARRGHEAQIAHEIRAAVADNIVAPLRAAA